MNLHDFLDSYDRGIDGIVRCQKCASEDIQYFLEVPICMNCLHQASNSGEVFKTKVREILANKAIPEPTIEPSVEEPVKPPLRRVVWQ